MSHVPVLTITAPDNSVTRIIDGFAGAKGYKAISDDGEVNSETKEQFFKRKVFEYIKAGIAEFEATSSVQQILVDKKTEVASIELI